MVFVPASKHIAEYLEDQSVGTVGTDIFVGFMPDTPDTCIGVYEYAGMPPDVVAEEYELAGIQVKVRADAQEDAYDLAYDCLKALHMVKTTTIEGVYYYLIEALGSPNQIGRDKNARAQFTINFRAMKEIE